MEPNRANRRWILGIVLLGILASWLLNSLRFPAESAAVLWGLAVPFLLGLVLAFLLNLPMRLINKKLLKGRGGKFNRAILLAITLLLLVLLLFLFFYLLVPQLVQSISTLADKMPEYLQSVENWAKPYLTYVPALGDALNNFSLDWKELGGKAWGWLQQGGGSVWGAVSGAASSLFSGVATFFIALFFAFNVVLGKEKWIHQFKSLLRAYLPDKAYWWLQSTGRLANQVFSAYVGGQCLEALIVGVVYMLVLGIGGFPYALLISVLTAFSSFIPLFGVYIAYIIGLFLVAVAGGFWRAVAFTIIFLVLQQIEGNILYPKIVGDAVGLAPGWVLVAITVGGGLFGIGGILFFIPLTSVVYRLVYRDAKTRLAKKGNKRGGKYEKNNTSRI